MSKDKDLLESIENKKKSLETAKNKLKQILKVIKACIARGEIPPSALINEANHLSEQYPELSAIAAQIKELNEKATQEAGDKKLFNSQDKTSSDKTTFYKTTPYTVEQYKLLIQKENAYFNDPKTKERHELIDKMMNGAHIDDNDPSGKSLTSKQFINLIDDISSEETKARRQESSERLACDAGEIKEQQKLGIPLTDLEKERGIEIERHVDKAVNEELYIAKLHEHKAIYAEEMDKRVEEVTTEEVVEAKGNKIIDEVKNIFPKIKQAFKGMEEKLTALLFHNPQAIGEHHDNIDQLQIEAEKAHQRHQEYEKEKLAENKTMIAQEAKKEIVIVTKEAVELKVEEAKVGESKEAAEAEQNTTAEKKEGRLNKIAAMKAKKAAEAAALKAIGAIKEAGIIIEHIDGTSISLNSTNSNASVDLNKKNSHEKQ